MNFDTTEPVREAITPEQMRAELHRHRHFDGLVRRVMDESDYRGLSSEDRYTILAYHLLITRAELMKQLLEWHSVRPLPAIIMGVDKLTKDRT